jgi:hypothetical protein
VDGVKDNKIRETWDRLVLLLIAQPREGWEPEFEEITRREIERLFRLANKGAMSTRKTISVIRPYRPEPDDCTRALALLLKKSVRKEATRPGGPDDAKEINDCAAKTNGTR